MLTQQRLQMKCLHVVGVSPVMGPRAGRSSAENGSRQTGQSAGGVSMALKASGLFATHSRVKLAGAHARAFRLCCGMPLFVLLDYAKKTFARTTTPGRAAAVV
jgi:hypothetical protein